MKLLEQLTQENDDLATDRSRFTDGQPVFLVSRTEMDQEGVGAYLDHIGAHEYKEVLGERQADELLSDGAELVMIGGKLCYKSFEPGLNPNVSKVRDDPGQYLGNIIASGHGSVTEHVNYGFIFADVSRVFTHELVRHRHEAISQESMRYVRLEELRVWLPALLEPVSEEASVLLKLMEDFQIICGERLFDEDMDFADKKLITSAMRRFAPIGISTSMMWTANIRSLRHIIEMRTSPHAEIEIRNVFREVGSIMKTEEPELFQDFKLVQTDDDPDGAWVSKHAKI